MLQVMLLTLETEREASLGCRARILTLFIYDFSFPLVFLRTCITFMVLWICNLEF